MPEPSPSPSPLAPAEELPSSIELTSGDRARELGRLALTWVKKDLKLALFFMILAGAVSWLANVVIVAVVYDGIGKVPPGSPAVGTSNEITGSLSWALAMALAFGMLAYRMQVGGPRFWSDLRHFPRSLVDLLRHDGDSALGHILWGVAGSMLVAAAVTPAAGALLALGVVALLGRVLRTAVTGLMMLAWRKVVGTVAPNRKAPPQEQTFGVAMLGAVFGLLVAYGIPDPSLKLLAGVAAGVGAFVLGRRHVNPSTALWLVVLGCAALLGLSVHEIQALAADGGWRENGGDLNAWLNGGGLAVITASQAAGIGGAAGGLAGAGLGSALDGRSPTEEQLKAKYLQTYMRINGTDAGFEDWWKQSGFYHPDGPTGPQAFLDGLISMGSQVKGEFTNFDYAGFFRSEARDFASGDMANRLWELDQSMVNTFIDQANKQVVQPLGVAADFWTHPDQWKDISQLSDPIKEGLKTSADFWKTQGLDGIRQMGGELANMTQDQYNSMQSKMDEFNAAVAAGDNAKASQMIGELAGNAEFMALMAKGPESALEKLQAFKAAAADARMAKLAEQGLADSEKLKGVGKFGQGDLLYGKDGVALNPEDLHPVGINTDEANAISQYAKDHNLQIEIKPGSEEAIAQREAGALGKPENIKSKSTSPYDQYIGIGTQEDKGLVGFGQPTEPVRPPGMSQQDWGGVQDQYQKRLGEFNDKIATMQKLQTQGMDVLVDGKPVHATVDWQGGGSYTDPATGKTMQFGDNIVYAKYTDPATGQTVTRPFAGDIDSFSLRDANGNPLPPGEASQHFANLNKVCPGVVHEGDTQLWDAAGGKLQHVKDDVMWHQAANNENAQNNIRFSADGSIQTSRGPDWVVHADRYRATPPTH